MNKVMKSLLLALVVFGSLNVNLNATGEVVDSEVDFATIGETEETEVLEESISYEIVSEDQPSSTSRSAEPEIVYSEEYMGSIEEKEEVNAGNDVLVFDTEGTVELTVNEENVLVEADETTATDTFVVEDGEIVSAEDAFFMTSGGVGETVNIYPTIEAASAGVNGTPINATGDDGQYIETVDYNNEDYVHVEISGYEGYMEIDDVQIIPTDFAQAQSFYVLQDGQWYYNVAVDPLTSSEYVTYPMATTPEWAVENVKYYSSDDITFVPESSSVNSRSTRASSSYNSVDYYQNLSIRSQSAYTAKNYNDYLQYVGASDSQYYNHTSAFVEAQNVKQINSLFLFAFANHESAYGQSYYSRQCNNFFGRGAYDSNPDNACIEFGYPTPEDGILAQAYFLQNNYLDTDEFLYYGAYPGNLAGGMNVKYATDPNWGKAIASHMFQTDKALGSKDAKKYRTVALTTSVPAYTTSDLSTNVQTDKGNNYYFETGGRTNGNPTGGRGGAGIRAIVVGETQDALKVQIETPMNTGASGNYATSAARRGSYPTFEGDMNPVYVPSGATSYAVNYGDFSKQQVWIPKSVNGNPTYVVLNDVAVPQEPTEDLKACVLPPPVQNGEVYAFSKDGSVNCSRVYINGVVIGDTKAYFQNGIPVLWVSDGYNLVGSPSAAITREYYPSGREQKLVYSYFGSNRRVNYRVTEYYYESGVKSKEEKTYLDSNATIVEVVTTSYDTNGKKTQITTDRYNSSGVLIFTETSSFSTNGVMTQTVSKDYTNGVLSQERNMKYDANGNEISHDTKNFNASGQVTSQKINYFDSRHVLKSNEIIAYSDGVIVKNEKNYFQTDKVVYKQYTEEYSNGQITASYLYEYNSKGVPTRAYRLDYHSNGEVKTITEVFYAFPLATSQTIQEFDMNGNKTKVTTLEYKNGNNIKATEEEYAPTGYMSKKTIYTKKESGMPITTETYTYNSNNKVVQYNKLTYNTDGSKKAENIKYYDDNGNFIREENINY